MFDKAEQAETEAKAGHQLKDVVEELDELKKQVDDPDKEASKGRISELETRRTQLEAELEQHQEQKEDSEREES
ncbi:MAG: hypothetical protein JRJ64_13665 [Deltaproteobacteria bacterium]|nr:hypothetical protein [Deltaproteobacteria bacterium]